MNDVIEVGKIRQRSGKLTFVRAEWITQYARKQRVKMAILKCDCGRMVKLRLGQWCDNPTQSCKHCSIQRGHLQGRGRVPPWQRTKL